MQDANASAAESRSRPIPGARRAGRDRVRRAPCHGRGRGGAAGGRPRALHPRGSRLLAGAWLAASLAGCPGQQATVPPPAPGGPAPTALACPGALDDPPPDCPGLAITGLTLACSAPPGLVVGPGNRIAVTLAQGSTVNGIVRTTPLATINEPCHGIGPNYPITITFGLEYSALLGPSAPLCIARSKLSFTQFEVSGSVFNSAWNPTVRSKVQGQVHMDLDERVIAELSTPAPGASPRCANWQELP